MHEVESDGLEKAGLIRGPMAERAAEVQRRAVFGHRRPSTMHLFPPARQSYHAGSGRATDKEAASRKAVAQTGESLPTKSDEQKRTATLDYPGR